MAKATTTTDTGPVPTLPAAPLVQLTDSSEGELRTLLEQVEGNRMRILQKRDEHQREIDTRRREISSLDVVLNVIGDTAAQYRRALGEPVPLALEPAPKTPVHPFDRVPDLSSDADTHMAAFMAQHEAQAAREGVVL